MYVAGPPTLGTGPVPDGRTLRLAAVHRFEFGAESRYTSQDRTYFTDLFATFGTVPDENAFESGRTTFRDMAARLVLSAGELADGFDMAVLAHATPDAEPGWPMSVLVEAVPGAGLVLGVSDQGVVAPFTAMRLVLDQVYDGPVIRAAVWILDQSATLHTEPVPDNRRATRNAAVALVLTDTGTLGPFGFAQQHSCEDAVQVRAALDAALTQLADDGPPVTVVCGEALVPYVEHHPLAGAVRVAPAGQPCTGVWFVLADCLSAGDRVLIADYDEEFGYLGLCGMEPTGRSAQPMSAGGVR